MVEDKKPMESLTERRAVWKDGKLRDVATGEPIDLDSSAGAASVGKWSRAAVDDRRRKVWEMHTLQGMPEVAIAKWFGVHRNTIVNDVRAIREANRKAAAATDPFAEIGDMTHRLDDVAQKAMLEYASTDSVGGKAQFLNTALKALEQKTRLQFESGTVPKAVSKVEGTLHVDGLDLKKMTLDELHKMRHDLVLRGASLPDLMGAGRN